MAFQGLVFTDGIGQLIQYLTQSIDKQPAKPDFLKDVQAIVAHDQLSAVGMTFELASNALGKVTVGNDLRSIPEVVVAVIDKNHLGGSREPTDL